jgi:hypothetical protein
VTPNQQRKTTAPNNQRKTTPTQEMNTMRKESIGLTPEAHSYWQSIRKSLDQQKVLSIDKANWKKLWHVAATVCGPIVLGDAPQSAKAHLLQNGRIILLKAALSLTANSGDQPSPDEITVVLWQLYKNETFDSADGLTVLQMTRKLLKDRMDPKVKQIQICRCCPQAWRT